MISPKFLVIVVSTDLCYGESHHLHCYHRVQLYISPKVTPTVSPGLQMKASFTLIVILEPLSSTFFIALVNRIFSIGPYRAQLFVGFPALHCISMTSSLTFPFLLSLPLTDSNSGIPSLLLKFHHFLQVPRSHSGRMFISFLRALAHLLNSESEEKAPISVNS